MCATGCGGFAFAGRSGGRDVDVWMCVYGVAARYFWGGLWMRGRRWGGDGKERRGVSLDLVETRAAGGTIVQVEARVVPR